MDHSLVKALSRELVEPPNGVEILLKTWRSKFGVALSQVVAREVARCGHAAGQEAPAQRAVSKESDLVLPAIGKHVLVDCALEQIVGRLSRMKWRDLAEFIHLRRAEVADADRSNFPVAVQRADGFGGFRNRRARIRPVHLIEIDHICSKPPKRILDFFDNACPARVAERLAILSVKSGLCGDDRLPTAAAGKGFSDDLLRATESIDGRGVDEIDSALERFLDRLDGIAFVGPAPHPAADRPRPECNARCADGCAGEVDVFHVSLRDCVHCLLLLVGARLIA
jgi:hypothetical protein